MHFLTLQQISPLSPPHFPGLGTRTGSRCNFSFVFLRHTFVDVDIHTFVDVDIHTFVDVDIHKFVDVVCLALNKNKYLLDVHSYDRELF